MLRSLKDLEKYTASATDGDIGRVVDFLLDDELWTVRYLVVEPGTFLDGLQVLISPISFRNVEWAASRFHLALTMEKVRNSPSVDTDKSVSRLHERGYNRYYGFPYYWGSSGLWGKTSSPGLLAEGGWTEEPLDPSENIGEVHLRSTRDVRGYVIQGSDETIGHVEDFVADDETWQIRYLVVDTSNWLCGKKVLVAPDWATRISWEEKKVYLDMPRQAVKMSPQWNETDGITIQYEARLLNYYDRPANARTDVLIEPRNIDGTRDPE